MSIESNPYAPPKAVVQDIVQGGSDAELIRQEHIKHEASVRSIGVLYYIGGAFMLLASLAMLPSWSRLMDSPLLAVIMPIYLVLGVVSIVLARGIRALQPWARTGSIVLSILGLLGFPLGTLVNAYILWLLLSKKGKRIFQEDYPAIVAATPHIKYRTSVVVWILLGLIVLLVAAAIGIPLLRR